MKSPKTLNFIFLLFLSQIVFAGEFLIKDEVRVIDVNVSPWSGRTTWMFNGVGPSNWESPDNYYTGEFHIRYEIISQPTNRACMAQMAIWQDWHDDYSFWREQASSRTALYGEGDVATYVSSPSTWWKLDDIPLEFSRPADFYKLGIIIWSADPLGRISAQLGPDDPEDNFYDDLWDDRADWFPMSLRITIVAVSEGSAFSGWETYLDDSDPGIQPEYTIDYINEQTSEDIITQHEYSYDNSTWFDGSGSNLNLTPGTTIYFRDKNDNGLSQILIVDPRPSTPDFAIDYLNERTSTPVSSAVQYATLPDMTGSQTGTGSYIQLTPGTDMYFRKPATSSQFSSAIQTLVVPGRPDTPAFNINYENETTSETISSAFEYSTSSDMSDAQAGSGNYLSLIPGADVYFQQPATVSGFVSGIQHLEVPARPPAPEFTIDYIAEATNEPVCCTVLYSNQSDFNGGALGVDTPVDLNPGEHMFFRIQSTDSNFKSDVFHLSVPDRPVITSSSLSPTSDNPILCSIDFGISTTGLSNEKLTIQNATLQEVTGEYDVALIPITEDEVSLTIEANTVYEGNFSSETFTITYKEDVNEVSLTSDYKILLYPNPVSDLIHIGLEGPEDQLVSIAIINTTGKVIFENSIQTESTTLDLTELDAGIYILLLKSRQGVIQKRIIKSD